MRKQDKAIIWPAYFDASKTRKNGRRVPKNMAIVSPKIDELQIAASRLRINNEVVEGAGYAKTPWSKSGMILVEKKAPKEQIIKQLAKQLIKVRSEQTQQSLQKKA
ncbi:MAG TPA: signal recognition particle subunit SRP19/SEC65 family protein [Candidatus Sulfotelmatobacter sp.]|jgi:signal recognition particle subunit SRP19|nr:signal recognition particle subunit SRP19/SEC65 family protein [Candidatus Sulfotelmatobacter sp.]